MRCLSCNEVMTREEEGRTFASSNEDVGLCDICIRPVQKDINYVQNGQGSDPFLEEELESLELDFGSEEEYL